MSFDLIHVPNNTQASFTHAVERLRCAKILNHEFTIAHQSTAHDLISILRVFFVSYYHLLNVIMDNERLTEEEVIDKHKTAILEVSITKLLVYLFMYLETHQWRMFIVGHVAEWT
jgi:hypothetical protein